jgi:hypothetical protein
MMVAYFILTIGHTGAGRLTTRFQLPVALVRAGHAALLSFTANSG